MWDAVNTHHINLRSDPEHDSRNVYLLTFGCIFAAYLAQSFIQSRKTFQAPYVGFRSWFEPKAIVGLRFATGALAQVTEGYEKVRYIEFACSPNI